MSPKREGKSKGGSGRTGRNQRPSGAGAPVQAGSPGPVADLARDFEQLDVVELSSALGSLQLVPENQAATSRLDLASRVACLAARPDGRRVSRSRLRSILRRHLGALSPVAFLEDPLHNLFTENVEFHGNFIVYPGVSAGGPCILQNLLFALFAQEQWKPPREFRDRVFLAAKLILWTSNEMAVRRGHDRYMLAPDHHGQDMVVPSAGFNELRQCTRFAKSEVCKAIDAESFDHPVLRALTICPGDETLAVDETNRNPLLIRPFLDVGEEIVVASPGALADALRHVIITEAQVSGVLDGLLAAYRDCIRTHIDFRLFRSGYEPERIALPSADASLPIAEGLYRFDQNKLAYVVVASDDGAGYKPDEPFGHWPAHGLSQRLRGRQEDVFDSVHQHAHLRECKALQLVVWGGIGRSYFLAVDHDGRVHRSVSASYQDMGAILCLMADDPLAVWQYAGARERLRAQAGMTAFSELDVYSLYASREQSFYLADDGVPDCVTLCPGTGLDLKAEAARRTDRHAVFRVDDLAHVSVESRHRDRAVPIYVIPELVGHTIEMVVEGYGAPIWVKPRSDTGKTDSAARSMHFQVTDALASWLWHVQPGLKAHLDAIDESLMFLVTFELAGIADWAEGRLRDPCGGVRPRIGVSVGERRIHLVLPKELLPDIAASDNRGERHILRCLLRAFGVLLEVNHKENTLTEELVDGIVETHAPLGTKKHIHLIDTTRNPGLNPTGLPRLNLLKDCDLSEQLDHMADDGTLQSIAPQVASGQRGGEALCNRIVDVYHSRLKAQTATLRWDLLAEMVIGQNEAICYEREENRFMAEPTRACFGHVGSWLDDCARRSHRMNETALSARVLLEFLAAEPPRGEEAPTLEDYGRLAAIVCNLVNYGMLSDSLHLGVSDEMLSLLPSGRVGIERSAHADPLDAFMEDKTAEHLDGAADRYRGHFAWRPGPASSDGSEQPEDRAYVAEFGLTVSQISRFHWVLIQLAFEGDSVCGQMPLSRLEEVLRTRGGLTEPVVSRAIEQFSLRPRKRWDEAPAGLEASTDIWPWRYNRGLSYARRPLVVGCGPEHDPLCLWGPRHVWSSLKNLYNLVLNGRLRAVSADMKALMGAYSRERGLAFSRHVASWLAERSELRVETEVPIRPGAALDAPRDLGDIDILAIDANHSVLYSLECKDLLEARTPREMANELGKLASDDTGEGSLIAKHTRRHQWLAANVPSLCTAFALGDTEWRVVSAVITSTVLSAPYLRKLPLPCIAFPLLRREGLASLRGLHSD